jgi:hypothetical protein
MRRSIDRFRRTHLTAMFALASFGLTRSPLEAQQKVQALLQVEVTDSKGIPLPDAKIETFTFLEGGTFREWAEVVPDQLPTGIYLMRFSHPGYRSSTFSVPLQHGVIAAVRVRLHEGSDSVPRPSKDLQSTAPEAIVVAFDGKTQRDLFGHRRVFDQIPHDEGSGARLDFTNPMVKARKQVGTVGKVDPMMRDTWKTQRGEEVCPRKTLVDGDTRHAGAYGNGRRRPIEDIEAVEVFTEGAAIPQPYRIRGSDCGLIVVWYRS